jgi:hypothetical protein
VKGPTCHYIGLEEPVKQQEYNLQTYTVSFPKLRIAAQFGLEKLNLQEEEIWI